VAIDPTSKFASIQLVTKTGRLPASAVLVALIEAMPCKIHAVLADNPVLSGCRRQTVEGSPSRRVTAMGRWGDGATPQYVIHRFVMRCRENGIEHRLTKIKHPRTNRRVERTGRSRKRRQTLPLR
jgi:hypothetical protein